MTKVYVESYGCTMNHGEAENLKAIFVSRGYELVQKPELSDVIVVFTCTVIGYTERKIKKRLRELSKLGKKLVITGCMAAVHRKELKEEFPDAILVPPTFYIFIPELIEGKEVKLRYVPKADLPKLPSVICTIPIGEGCNQDCSYCVTKIARGRIVRSYPMELILRDVRRAVSLGAKEIRLSSQDTAVYGTDLGYSLADLIKEITKIPGNFKVRVGMMNPHNAIKIWDELLDAFSSEKVYKFLHIPVQSGSERILKRMKRGHGRAEYIYIVNSFRSNFEKSTISTDIIVGFPGESDEDFRESYRLIERTRPNIVNITRFSPRPYTEAARMENQIPGWLSKARSSVLASLVRRIGFEENSKRIGETTWALITERGKGSSVVARDESYRPIVIEGEYDLGEEIEVEITGATSTYLLGNPIKIVERGKVIE